MSLSRLFVYVTAHRLDDSEAHLEELGQVGFKPDVVAIEEPDVPDKHAEAKAFLRNLIKNSPATGFSVYYMMRAQELAYKQAGRTAKESHSESKAGRQLAQENGIPLVSVDIPYAKQASLYTTWPRRIRDNIFFFIGIGMSLLLIGSGVSFIVLGSLFLLNRGFSFLESIVFLFGLILALGLIAMGRYVLFYTIGKIGGWFLDTTRNIRDAAMFQNILSCCKSQQSESALMIVGAAHWPGIKSLAESSEVECTRIESPAISRHVGNIDELSPGDLSKFTSI